MNAKRVLVAVDDSDVSRRVAGYVAQVLAGRSDVCVRLLSILPPIPASLLKHDVAEDPQMEEQLEALMHAERDSFHQRARDDAEVVFAGIKDILRDGGVPGEIIETETFADRIRITDEINQVVSDLLDVAKTGSFGTIVIGRTRLSRWADLFRHHVAEELVHRARNVSVWVVG
jgi:nucleotide-binding universal stress UspA family protein